MSDSSRATLIPRLVVALALGIAASAAALAWLGFGAVGGWRQSALSASERRNRQAVDLLARALTRDMRGAQGRVLGSPHWDEFMLEPPHSIVRIVASAFARYPYPESFFAWRAAAKQAHPIGESITFFTRSDRPPSWLPFESHRGRFPVTVVDAAPLGPAVLDRIRRDARRGRRFSAFDLGSGPGRTQVIARLLYRDEMREDLEAVFGFTVDLAWVRAHYFPEVVRQVARISGSEAPVSLAVVDSSNAPVTRAAVVSQEPVIRRSIPLIFFDPSLIETDPPPDLIRESWAVEVGASDDPSLRSAIRGANRTLALAALAAGTLVLGLGLTVRAARANARLADLRSDFVATVTHELKTPVATIRALGDTLVAGRVSEPATRHEYAQLVVQEAKRLARLIDNLLAYARVTDVADVYRFEGIDLNDAVEEALAGFGAQIEGGGFEVRRSIPDDLPPLQADRTALRLLLENLVDNAIRYSRDERRIEIAARRAGRVVEVSVSDRGIGIPADEIDKVAQKFFRGRHAGSGGTGLGLAIARRIAEDHGGRLLVRSGEGAGTTATVTLPAAS